MAATYYTVRSGATQHPEAMFGMFENSHFLSSGVVDRNNNDFLVEQSDTPAASVDVRQGRAFLVNSDLSVSYPVRLTTSDDTVSISANSSGNDRIDAVVLYVDLGASPNTTATNVAQVTIVEGTPAASPVAPTNSEIEAEIGASNPYTRLADVTAQNGFSSITDSDITDRRVDAKRLFSLGEELSGWRPLGYDMAYASATTVTVDGVDVTDIIQVGHKIKMTQPTDGVKYFYVTAVSFSTDTTITLTAGDDYDLDNEAIYQPYYSAEAHPFGFPARFSYTPSYSADGSMTYTSVTTNIAEFSVQGRLVTTQVVATGTTGGSADVAMRFTLPITSTITTAGYITGGCSVSDSSALSGFYRNNDGDVIRCLKYDGSNFGLGGNRRVAIQLSTWI